jgi:rhomboid family GlyGly-CTERM serine protease
MAKTALNFSIPSLSRQQFAAGWPIWLWLVLTALLLCWPSLNDTLRYERDAVSHGEWWRLISANLVHGNGWHWLLNAASASFQFWLFQGLGSRRWWWAVGFICLPANVLGMHVFSPGVSWYVGMSGALYGTAVFGGLLLLANREWLVGGVLSAYLLGRILYEQAGASTAELAQLITIPVAVDAHLWGLVSGYLLALCWWLMQSRR